MIIRIYKPKLIFLILSSLWALCALRNLPYSIRYGHKLTTNTNVVIRDSQLYYYHRDFFTSHVEGLVQSGLMNDEYKFKFQFLNNRFASSRCVLCALA